MQDADLLFRTAKQNQGLYTVEVKLLTMDDQDTGVSKLLQVNVIDPCMAPTLAINESVFKTPGVLTLEQFVGYAPL